MHATPETTGPMGASAGRNARRLGHEVLLATAAIIAYVALDWVSYIHPTEQYGITPWNPQPSVAIALLMILGQRWLPAVFAAVVAAEYFVRGAPAPWPATLLMAAVLALGYAAIAAALSGPFAISRRLDKRQDVVRLVVVTLAGALVTGLLYVAAIRASGLAAGSDFLLASMRFWIGDSVGILVTLPALLMALAPERRRAAAALLRRKETAIQVVAIALALWAVFDRPVGEQVKFFYLLFLPLVWIAARHGMIGAALAALVIQGALIGAVITAGYQALTVFELQALLIALTVTGLFLGVAVDEQHRAEEELRASLRMAAAAETAAAVAHELNQPLTALSTYARACVVLAQPHSGNAQLVETLGKVVGEADRAANVVRRLRDFFRTGATELRPASLADLAATVVESLRARADALGVVLEQRRAGSIPGLLMDVTQMEIVLRNLLTNAIDSASRATGERRVALELDLADERNVRGSVTDTGSGVAAADAERIFEPLATTRATGMGMGLAISRAIIEAHGGRLWVEPGSTGVFRFTLPLAGDA
jgi:two-component system sensor kinase FixL